MENSGVNAGGSTYIEFDNVKVPVENLLGRENSGFKYIMASKSKSSNAFFVAALGSNIERTDLNPERLILAGSAFVLLVLR
jgi:hypothetical protein